MQCVNFEKDDTEALGPVHKIWLIYKGYYGENKLKRKIQDFKNSQINPYNSLMKDIIGISSTQKLSFSQIFSIETLIN